MFNNQTTIEEILNYEPFSFFKGQFISSNNVYFTEDDLALTLSQYQATRQPTWNADDICYGLNNLNRIVYENDNILYPLGDNSKSQPQLIYLPAKNKSHNTFVLLLAGGAYGAVCTMVEALPVGARLNKMGYDCFALNYRTADETSFKDGLMPKPLEDTSKSLKKIKECFGFDISDYILVGFSAGAHTASLWGTKHLGARKYNLPQPKMVGLIYPLISMQTVPEGAMKKLLCHGMFGKEYNDETLKTYDASSNTDAQYPPFYLVRCNDDTTVSPENSELMESAAQKNNIKYETSVGYRGGHGFGLGTKTDVCGWIEKIMDFYEELDL